MSDMMDPYKKEIHQHHTAPSDGIFRLRSRAWEWDVINDVLRLPAINQSRIEIRIADFFKYILPEDRRQTLKLISRALYEKKPFQATMRLHLQDREEMVLAVEGETLYDRYSRPIKMVGFFRKSPRLLEKADERAGETHAVKYIGNWEWNAGKNEANWSDEVFEIYGLEPQSFVPKAESYLQYVHPEDRPALAEAWENAVRCDKSFRVQHRIILANGKERTAILQGGPKHDDNGKLLGMDGVLLDITDRIEQDKQLAKSRQILQQVIDNAPIGIFWRDRSLRFQGCNKFFAAMCGGLIPEDFIGRRYAQQCGELLEKDKYDTDDRYVMETGNSKLDYIETIASPQGERICRTSKVPLYDENGEIYGVLGVTQDITDIKRSEEERQRLQDTEAKAQREKELVTDFFTNISHEFKTPLSIILIQLELMSMYMDDSEKMDELIAAATQNTYRLTRLVGNLLDLTRIESGYMRLNITQVDIAAMIRELCASVEDYASVSALRLDFETEVASLVIPMDTDKLERILLNLISNAIKHTMPGGSIRVKLEGDENAIRISVKDTGEGIPKDKLDMIFDRFSQVNSSLTRKSEGTGIGLALVKSLVDLMGGKISVVSERDKGSTFTVELPSLEANGQPGTVRVEGYDLHRRTALELSDIYIKPKE